MEATPSNQKTKAQGLVEFALILPLLLLIILGLIEAGRLIFIYSAITTASREGARFGSATGVTAGVARFQNCQGIKDAAIGVGVLAELQSGDITIEYFSGPGDNTPNDTCNGATDTSVNPNNGDQISVSVIGHYSPIIPIPFMNRSGDSGFNTYDITSTTRRTILRNVKIETTPDAPPTAAFTYTPPPTPTPTDTPIFSPTPTDTPIATPTFTPIPPSPTPVTPTAVVCQPRYEDFIVASPNKQFIYLPLRNLGGTPITISEIQIFWPSGSARILEKIGLAGTEIWNFGTDKSPWVVNTNWVGTKADRQIPGNNTPVDLTLQFNKNMASFSALDFRVLIKFEEAVCPNLDTDDPSLKY